jgi:hypothetical protein
MLKARFSSLEMVLAGLAKTEGTALSSQLRFAYRYQYSHTLFAITGNNIHTDNYIDASLVQLATELWIFAYFAGS